MLGEFVLETSESVPQHKLPPSCVPETIREYASAQATIREYISAQAPSHCHRTLYPVFRHRTSSFPLQGIMTLCSFKIYRSLTVDAASHWSGLLRHGGQFLDVCTSKQDPSWQTSLPTTYTSPRGWGSLRPVRIKEGSAASLV